MGLARMGLPHRVAAFHGRVFFLEAVEAACGIAPDRLLFTDDRADNITAAARRGWRTHQFVSWQGWARRLVAEGLLTEREAGL